MVAAAGVVLGCLFSRLRKPHWTFGYFIPLAVCRSFKDIRELKQAGLTLAVIKYAFLVDHYVTVLEVTDTEVVVGDPIGGLRRMSYADFRKEWRFVGVVLKRRP